MEVTVECYLSSDELTRWRRICSLWEAVHLGSEVASLDEMADIIEEYYTQYHSLLCARGLDQEEDYCFDIDPTCGAIQRWPIGH